MTWRWRATPCRRCCARSCLPDQGGRGLQHVPHHPRGPSGAGSHWLRPCAVEGAAPKQCRRAHGAHHRGRQEQDPDERQPLPSPLCTGIGCKPPQSLAHSNGPDVTLPLVPSEKAAAFKVGSHLHRNVPGGQRLPHSSQVHRHFVAASRRWSPRSPVGPGALPRRKPRAAAAAAFTEISGTRARDGGPKEVMAGRAGGACGCSARSLAITGVKVDDLRVHQSGTGTRKLTFSRQRGAALPSGSSLVLSGSCGFGRAVGWRLPKACPLPVQPPTAAPQSVLRSLVTSCSPSAGRWAKHSFGQKEQPRPRRHRVEDRDPCNSP